MEGWERNYAKAQEAQRKGAYNPPIDSATALLDEHVHIAIASVWEGLRQSGFFIAFGTLVTFRANREQSLQVPDSEAVLGPEPMVIPLFLGREMPAEKVQQPKTVKRRRRKARAEPLGHHLLAVVVKQNDEAVDALIFDSAPGVRSSEEIQNVVGGLIRNTGWMGIDAGGGRLPVTPTIEYFYPTIPLQEGEDTCGFYQILNAWAMMLGIVIHPDRQRRTTTNSEDFLIQGVHIFNLAINGFMDSTTIEAFMKVHGYSDENPNRPLDSRIDTVAMSTAKLDEIMMDLRTRGRALAVQRTTTYSDEAIAEVMNGSGVNRSTALQALRKHNGNTDAATTEIIDEVIAEFGQKLEDDQNWGA